MNSIFKSFSRLFTSSFKAKILNDQLYADVHNVNSKDMFFIKNHITQQCQELGYSKEYTTQWLTHAYRLFFF